MTRCRKHEACHSCDLQPADMAKYLERLCIPAIGKVLPDGPADHVHLAIAPDIINSCSFPCDLDGLALRNHSRNGACRSGVSNAHFSGYDKVYSAMMSLISEQN